MMVYTKIDIHTRNIQPRLITLERNQLISEKEKSRIKEFLRLASIGKINLGKKIGEARLLKYLDVLIVPLVFFKKEMDKISVKDMEQFISDLEKDIIKRKDGNIYSASTKTDIKKVLKIYLKWRMKDKARFNKLTDWIDFSVKFKTPSYLKESEVEELYKACSDAKQRFIIAVLFDAGCRAEEFLNIRREDIFPPCREFPYYKIHFKEEYSKTSGRNIGLYWSRSTEAIQDYLSELKDLSSDEPVISDTYDCIRMFLSRLGKKVLKRRIYPHLFRHSSATYYAPKINRQQLCLRYGWKFTSNMPDVYISRAGIEEEEVKNKLVNTDMDKLERENQELQMKFALLKENSGKELAELKKLIEGVIIKANTVFDKKGLPA